MIDTASRYKAFRAAFHSITPRGANIGTRGNIGNNASVARGWIPKLSVSGSLGIPRAAGSLRNWIPTDSGIQCGGLRDFDKNSVGSRLAGSVGG
jgi:hypothetical protein